MMQAIGERFCLLNCLQILWLRPKRHRPHPSTRRVAQAVPTRVHVAHRGLFVVAINVQHLLVCGLGLELLHLLSGLLERGLEEEKASGWDAGEHPRAAAAKGGGEKGRERERERYSTAPQPPTAPPAQPVPQTWRRPLQDPNPLPSAAPPPPLGCFTRRQRARWPIAAPRPRRSQSALARAWERPRKESMRGRHGMGGLRGGRSARRREDAAQREGLGGRGLAAARRREEGGGDRAPSSQSCGAVGGSERT